MSHQPNNQRRAAPLAGRPPFATDEDDAVYDQVPAARPRQQLQPPNPNAGRADSMYQAWDNYLDTNAKDSRPNSGVGGIGMGLMAGGMDDSDDEEPPVYKSGSKTNTPAKSSNLKPSMPAASEKPKASFESSRSMGNANQPIQRPSPAATAPSATRQGSYDRPQYPQQNGMNAGPQHAPLVAPVPRQVQRPAAAALRVDVPPPARGQPMAAFMSPSPSPSLNPHPLNAPSTPITPVFARPSFQEPERKVEFAKDAILRGNSEETLLPRNTRGGEEFWRRFSYFAKEDPKTKSSWLKSTLGNGRSYTRWVWCISIFLLLAIGAGIGFGWYMTHNDPPSQPLAVGGSANESQLSTAVAAAATTNAAAAGTSRTLIPVTADTKRALKEYEYLERELEERAPAPMPTPAPLVARHHLRKRSRLNRLKLDALD